MANSHNRPRNRNTNIPHIKLPKFEPLPPDTWYNRLVNALLRPLFYLVFVMITSIIVVPIFTIIENFKEKSRSSSGSRGNHTGYTMNGQPVEGSGANGKAETFLGAFGASYGGEGRRRSEHRE